VAVCWGKSGEVVTHIVSASRLAGNERRPHNRKAGTKSLATELSDPREEGPGLETDPAVNVPSPAPIINHRICIPRLGLCLLSLRFAYYK